MGEQGEREIRPLPPQNAGCGCVRGAAGAGARSDLAISNCARPDHEQDAGGAEICCRPDRRPGMTQDLAGASAAPARGRSPAVDRVGSEDHVLHTRARCRRSASHACGQRRRVVRRAESRRARCAAVAARWWCACGRRALVGDRSPRRAGSERGAHWHTGQCVLCATLKSPSQTRKTVLSSSTTNPAVVGISAPGAAGRAALRKAAGLPLASSRPAAP